MSTNLGRLRKPSDSPPVSCAEIWTLRSLVTLCCRVCEVDATSAPEHLFSLSYLSDAVVLLDPLTFC